MFKKVLCLFLVTVGVLSLQACGRDLKPEEPCNFVQNNKSQRVSWGDNTPVSLYLDSSVPQEYYKTIEDAAEHWNKARGRQLLKIIGPVNSSSQPSRDGANIIYWLSEWEEDRPFEQARTTVYWAGDRIYEADVRVNAKDFNFFNGAQPGKVDVMSLLVHEFGHVLGLSHTAESGSVMVKSLANNLERREPSTNDVDYLKCEY